MTRKTWVIALLIGVVVVIGIYPRSILGSTCGGTPLQVEVSDSGQLHDRLTRKMYWDPTTGLLWQGGIGEILVYDSLNQTLEQCAVQLPLDAVVNDFVSWRGQIYAGLDNHGVLKLQDHEWSVMHPHDSLDEAANDVYGLYVDPRNDTLIVLSRADNHTYDGSTWSRFDLRPPLATGPYHVVVAAAVEGDESNYEWLLGSISDGTYRFFNGIWEHFTLEGMFRWSEPEQRYLPDSIPVSFPQNIRDIEPIARIVVEEPQFDTGRYQPNRWVIVGDEASGSGVILWGPGEPKTPSTYWGVLPTAEGFAFSHLTGAQALSAEEFIVTNGHELEGSGAYFSSYGTDTRLTTIPSLSVLVVDEYLYIGTVRGVYRLALADIRA